MAIALVTGGAGFIGSHLAERLLETGWQVRVLDDLSTGKRAHLAAIADQVDFVEGSINDAALLTESLTNVDVVFHLAAMVSVPRSIADPRDCHLRCASGTLEVLLAARAAGVRRVVYPGSASAYGAECPCPMDENAPLLALSPYAAGKLAGEHYCTTMSATTALETVRLRFFNVFGPRQDPSSPYSGVISLFCARMARGESPTIYGDGLQTRDFVYVADVVQALSLAATATNVNGRVFNIGSGSACTVLGLAEEINVVMGTRLAPQFAPARPGEVRHSQANIHAARLALGYQPRVSLRAGLTRCLADVHHAG